MEKVQRIDQKSLTLQTSYLVGDPILLQWIESESIYDAAAGGAFMNKERDESYEHLEEMASNRYQWQSDQAMPGKVAGVHEIDTISVIHAQLALLTKKLDATNISDIQTQSTP